MKYYLITPVTKESKLKEEWDRYSQRLGVGEKPKQRNPVPTSRVSTVAPKSGSYRRWSPKG